MATETTRIIDRPAPMNKPEPEAGQRMLSLRLTSDERRRAGVRWPKLLLWTLILLLATAGVGAALDSSGYLKPELPQVEAVRFAEKAQRFQLDLTGNIVPRVEISVSPQVGGRVIESPIIEGQKVRAGDLLFQVDDRVYRSDFEVAKAQIDAAKSALAELKNGPRPEEIEQARELVEQAKLQVDLSKNHYDRTVKLKEQTTRADFDSRLAEYKNAEAQLRSQEHKLKLLENGSRQEQIDAAQAEVERAEALLEKARFFVDNSRITAPIDGTVLRKEVEAWETIHPELVMTSMCVLADLNTLEAEVDVQEQDFYQISIGDPCRVLPDAYKDREYEGRVARIQPTVDRARGVVQVKVAITNPDEHLLVNMNCRVIFRKQSEENAAEERPATIPAQALVEQEGQKSVYVFDGKVVRKRAVEIGEAMGEEVAIRGGLQAGEIVLVPRGQTLAEGQQILPLLKGSEAETKSQ